ncbi:MAG TPA: transglycosylase domain-containing protein [Candidatus Krumholzibacteria bacterium]|nr:transglycosylase domain-containing protein [Candidatus Krumholzibacteria bacterium]
MNFGALWEKRPRFDRLIPRGPRFDRLIPREWRPLLRRIGLGLTFLLAGLTVLYAIRAGALRARVLSEFEDLAHNEYSHVIAEPMRVRIGTDTRSFGLVSRLERAGFVRGRGDLSPGQFRVEGKRVFFRRAANAAPSEGGDVRIDLDGAIISSIQEDGRAQQSVLLPSEHLTSFRRELYERRTPARYDQIPPGVVQAVLAAEDRRFFDHHGLDGRGIGRALWRNLRERRIAEGGSTITQQAVKLILRRRGRAVGAKLDEAILAVIVERHLTKQEILQVYLNELYFGQDGPFAVHGVTEGARHLFGKPLSSLSKREQIELAAVIRAPNAASPHHNRDRLDSYADAVTRALEQVHPPPEASDKDAAEEVLPPGFLLPTATDGDGIDFGTSQMAYYFDVLAREWTALCKRQRVPKPATLVASVDPLMQLRAAQALAAGLKETRATKSRKKKGETQSAVQGAVVVLDAETGAVRALVGGDDYAMTPFNRAIDIKRPVGSTFKPFVFLAAMGGGDAEPRITQSSWLPDEPREYRVGRTVWRPANFDGEYRGWITAREALSQSVNAATVALGMEIGVKNVARLAQDLGLAERVPANPSICLGALDTSPLLVTRAYAAIANGGHTVTPHALLEVRHGDRRLRVYADEKQQRVLDPLVAYVVTDMLVDALRTGTGASAAVHGFHHLATGKTGTTDDARDAWFAGYTPEIVTTVWVGHDDNRATNLTGARAALPIWSRFMRTWVGDSWDLDFEPPPGITFRRIDPTTGQLATSHCEEEEIAAFLEGTEPQEGCSDHRSWWTSDDGDETDARDERWQGWHKKPGFLSRLKNAFGV